MNKLIYVTIIFLPLFPMENDPIISCINQYSRPITFFMVDNKNASSLIPYAKTFPKSVFVLINKNDLIYHEIFPHNFIHLKTDGTVAELRHLGECEHFDIVWIKNHINKLNKKYAEVLYTLGENVFIDIKTEQKSFIEHMKIFNFKQISNSVTQKKLFHSYHPKTFLTRTQWLEPASESNATRHIISTFQEKKLHKKYDPRHLPTIWLPGINLMTFKILNGYIPPMNLLKEEIIRLFNIPHLDWMPNNIIVQGHHLELIDFDSFGSEAKTVHTQQMLELMLQFVEAEKTKIIDIFQEILIYCRNQLHPELKYRSLLSLYREV